MNPYRRLALVMLIVGFISPVAFAQSGQGSVLGKTDFGKSQNTSQDLANSLKPGPQKYGKGEKKADIDTKTLQSKKSNDKTFSGNLNDIGLDWNGDAMGKPHASQAANSTAGGHESSANRSRETEDAGSAHISISGELDLGESGPKSAKQSDAEKAKKDEPAAKDSKTKATDAGEKESKKSNETPGDNQKTAAAKADKQPDHE